MLAEQRTINLYFFSLKMFAYLQRTDDIKPITWLPSRSDYESDYDYERLIYYQYQSQVALHLLHS